jgi:hypothetical protein
MKNPLNSNLWVIESLKNSTKHMLASHVYVTVEAKMKKTLFLPSKVKVFGFFLMGRMKYV